MRAAATVAKHQARHRHGVCVLIPRGVLLRHRVRYHQYLDENSGRAIGAATVICAQQNITHVMARQRLRTYRHALKQHLVASRIGAAYWRPSNLMQNMTP